ncbi:CinA family protein [Flavihumibacter sp. ZG627]|uniref:CinA family protein n=1 Tax=Flavihumibacter sp. ZG627 TaxID=1463156 RepID=UPI00155A548B|nr:CinA family protein [Flavihumibacter sp. ZG627]
MVRTEIPLVEIKELGRILITRSKTIAIAESVTSGYIQAWISSADKATSFFQGGITVYNNSQKFKHLGIDPIKADKVNGVSAKIAEKMAMAAATNFGADYGCAITGYAAPDQELDIDQPYAWLAICTPDQVILHKRLKGSEGEFHEVQQGYARQAIDLLLKTII